MESGPARATSFVISIRLQWRDPSWLEAPAFAPTDTQQTHLVRLAAAAAAGAAAGAAGVAGTFFSFYSHKAVADKGRRRGISQLASSSKGGNGEFVEYSVGTTELSSYNVLGGNSNLIAALGGFSFSVRTLNVRPYVRLKGILKALLIY